jgi:hypothetical protein
MVDTNQVSLWEFWDYLKTRLSTERMGRLARGAGRVHVVDENYPEDGYGETEVWGRLIIVPTLTIWVTPSVPNETRKVGFLIRTDAHAPRTEAGFRASRMLEAMQAEARSLLQSHLPPAPFEHIKIVMPIYQWTAPQPLPLWDDEDGLYFLSSEYRTEGVNPNL